jgi:hypothetical protein
MGRVNVAALKSTTTLACVRKSIRVCAHRLSVAATTHAAATMAFTKVMTYSLSPTEGWESAVEYHPKAGYKRKSRRDAGAVQVCHTATLLRTISKKCGCKLLEKFQK